LTGGKARYRETRFAVIKRMSDRTLPPSISSDGEQLGECDRPLDEFGMIDTPPQS
jgi:hypothetical protein